MGGKKKAGTEVLACRTLDEEKSNSSEAGDESPVLKYKQMMVSTFYRFSYPVKITGID